MIDENTISLLSPKPIDLSAMTTPVIVKIVEEMRSMLKRFDTSYTGCILLQQSEVVLIASELHALFEDYDYGAVCRQFVYAPCTFAHAMTESSITLDGKPVGVQLQGKSVTQTLTDLFTLRPQS